MTSAMRHPVRDIPFLTVPQGIVLYLLLVDDHMTVLANGEG